MLVSSGALLGPAAWWQLCVADRKWVVPVWPVAWWLLLVLAGGNLGSHHSWAVPAKCRLMVFVLGVVWVLERLAVLSNKLGALHVVWVPTCGLGAWPWDAGNKAVVVTQCTLRYTQQNGKTLLYEILIRLNMIWVENLTLSSGAALGQIQKCILAYTCNRPSSPSSDQGCLQGIIYTEVIG